MIEPRFAFKDLFEAEVKLQVNHIMALLSFADQLICAAAFWRRRIGFGGGSGRGCLCSAGVLPCDQPYWHSQVRQYSFAIDRAHCNDWHVVHVSVLSPTFVRRCLRLAYYLILN